MEAKDNIIQHLKEAWDALETLDVRGFYARARVQKAQECILAIYNELNRPAPAEEEKEGGDGND